MRRTDARRSRFQLGNHAQLGNGRILDAAYKRRVQHTEPMLELPKLLELLWLPKLPNNQSRRPTAKWHGANLLR